jgi:uncharacterized membrane protein (UPF0136 family)
MLVIYGLVNIAGGAMAFMMPSVRSVPSLVAGGGAGLLLLACAWVAGKNPGLGLRTAGIVTFCLAGFWIYRIVGAVQESKPVAMAAGNLVMAVSMLAVLLIGHFSARRRAA